MARIGIRRSKYACGCTLLALFPPAECNLHQQPMATIRPKVIGRRLFWQVTGRIDEVAQHELTFLPYLDMVPIVDRGAELYQLLVLPIESLDDREL